MTDTTTHTVIDFDLNTNNTGDHGEVHATGCAHLAQRKVIGSEIIPTNHPSDLIQELAGDNADFGIFPEDYRWFPCSTGSDFSTQDF